MERDQIRQEVLDQLRLEREVKEQLERESAKPAPKKRAAWLDTKVGTLVVGALISGFLIPAFQFTQETIKWSRQNRYNALTQQIGDMRESMKQLVAAQALVAETYNLASSLPKGSSPDRRAALERIGARFGELRMKRLQQNAVFAGTFSFFPAQRRKEIRDAWQSYLTETDGLQFGVENVLATALQPAGAGRDEGVEGAVSRLGGRVDGCNATYEKIFGAIQAAIEEVQHEGARFQ